MSHSRSSCFGSKHPSLKFDLVKCLKSDDLTVFVELTVFADEGGWAFTDVTVISIDTGATIFALVFRASIVFYKSYN